MRPRAKAQERAWSAGSRNQARDEHAGIENRPHLGLVEFLIGQRESVFFCDGRSSADTLKQLEA